MRKVLVGGYKWVIWWHGSGPERGDHVMIHRLGGYEGEIAYIGDQHHDAAHKLVNSHNAVVDALVSALEKIAKNAASSSPDAHYLGNVARTALGLVELPTKETL